MLTVLYLLTCTHLLLRNQFPRIVVKYLATADGETGRHVLPDLLTAYLHMGDIQARDW